MSLPGQSKLVLEAIAQELSAAAGATVQTGDVYRRYQEVARAYGADVVHRTRVAQIVTELDMLGVINAPERRNGRGRTRKIILTSPPATILDMIQRSYAEGGFGAPMEQVLDQE